MSEVSRELIDEYAVRLDGLWLDAKSIIDTSWRQFDDNFGAGRNKQRIEALRYATKMDKLVREMLFLPLYMGNESHHDEYVRLEKVIVDNIVHVCRIDADMGLALRKIFLKGNRSIPAKVRVLWRTFVSRVGFWFDDGTRAPH